MYILLKFPILNFYNFKLKNFKYFNIKLNLNILNFYKFSFLYNLIKKELFIIKTLNTSTTKTRKNIITSKKKLRDQKKTGKARLRNLSSPLIKGGGIVFGPKIKQTNFKINNKEKKIFFQYLLYIKRTTILIIHPYLLKTYNYINKISLILKNFSIGYFSRVLLITQIKLNNNKFFFNNPYITIVELKNLKNIDIYINDYIFFFI